MFDSERLRCAVLVVIVTLLAAGYGRAPETEEDGLKMEFVRIPSGSFHMGSPLSEKDRENNEGPVHEVHITKPFYMGKYEVTQAQWKAVMGTTINQQRNKARYPWLVKGQDAEYPIYFISWEEAVEFCKRLGSNFRLPTEAEWEYTCRAGSKTRFYYGEDPKYSQLDRYAWYEGNSDNRTHPVGQKKPNTWGMYDMHGNVSEWCSEWYASPVGHKNTGIVDPTMPTSNYIERIRRGGSWYDKSKICRSASRYPAVGRTDFIGFRVVFAGQIDNGKKVLEIALPQKVGRILPAQEQQHETRAHGLAIGGVVRDEAGISIDGVDKQILPVREWFFREYTEGRFEAIWLPRESSARIQGFHFVARHKEQNLAVGTEIKEEANELDVKLKPGVILTGKVEDGNGKAIEEARVVINLQTSSWSGGFLSWMKADAEGRFEFRALPPGYGYLLSAQRKGYRVGQTEVRTEEVHDNRVDAVSIVLPRGEFSVSGEVVGTDGKPVPNVWVYCTGKGQVGINSNTDADGRFMADGIFEGQVEIIARIRGNDGGWLGGSISAEAGATNLRIVLGINAAPPPKGRTCFPAETGVWVNGAIVPISKVARGQTVGKLIRAVPTVPFGQIEKIEEHEGIFKCRDIVFEGGNRISVVGAHFFMLDTGKWIAAQELRSGLRLKTLNTAISIQSITARETPFVGKVYNLKIQNSDRYMVGKDGVIVRDF